MIKPVVNISKVIEPFDTVIVGLYGVLYDGRSFKTEAVEALKAMKRSGRKIVLVSNASLRVQQVIRLLNDNKVPVMVFDAVVTAGEILHYKLKVKDETFKGLGLTYFNIGGSEGLGVLPGLIICRLKNSAGPILCIWVPVVRRRIWSIRIFRFLNMPPV